MGAKKGAGKTAGVERIVTLQPAEYVDHITEDSRELTRLPYPYHVHQDGSIGRQDFWRGEPKRVVGFTADLAKQQVDLWWHEAFAEPERAVGMYLVTQNEDGNMHTVVNAIAEATVTEVDR